MAQLKDTAVVGNLAVTGTTSTAQLYINQLLGSEADTIYFGPNNLGQISTWRGAITTSFKNTIYLGSAVKNSGPPSGLLIVTGAEVNRSGNNVYIAPGCYIVGGGGHNTATHNSTGGVLSSVALSDIKLTFNVSNGYLQVKGGSANGSTGTMTLIYIGGWGN
jgi:hypothetical protein